MYRDNFLRCAFMSTLLASSIIVAKQANAQDIPAIRIAPSTAYGGSISSFFDRIEFIPLKTTKESLLGAVDKLVITESSFIAGDWDTKSVYFFSLDGKLITKVKLPQEGSLGMDVSYEQDQKRVAIRYINWSTERGECKYYSVIGAPLNVPTSKISKDNATLVYFGKGYNIGANIRYLNRGEKAKDSVFNLITIYKGNEVFKSLLPFNQAKSLALSRLMGGYSLMWGHPIRVLDNNFYIASPLTFEVYKVNLNGAKPIFRFVLPADRVIPKALIDKNDIKSIDSLSDEIAFNNKLVLQISNIFFWEKYISFKLMPKIFLSKPSSEPEFQYNFLYDTLSKKLIGLERLVPDSSSFYLQPFGHKTNRDGLEFFDGYFYTSLSSLEIINQWEKTKNKVEIYPAVLEEFFRTENRKSNPIIVRMKLRK